MITAEEARKETTKNLETFSTIELVTIEKKIREAIKQGYYEIPCDGCLSKQTKKILEDAGFTVEIGLLYYSISWK